MNNTQRVLLSIYLPITFLILVLDNVFPGVGIVWYLKYTIIITLFLSALNIRKKFREQNIMTLSLFFVVAADFFLVYSLTLKNLKINLIPFGIIGFLLAYLCLIVAYQKNFRVGKKEFITAVFIIVIFLLVSLHLIPHIKGVMLIETLIFWFVLCYMTWTSICTIFRKYYNAKIARLIALSSILMFICDIGVAYGLFYPVYSEFLITLVKNIVWAAYIMGWTFLTIIISEENLLD
ncbi:lysoplasmalogenase family protein [Clostridium arbusti]|uniref:lysoplasmalogenase family protein n=1 Tax=Clostridium arbusti TaxID=1137848 RepID=UPI000287BA2A|nr:lysoplasmalogenase family protein [Clostridium arbusti]